MFVTLLTTQDEILSLNVAYVEQCPVTHALPVHDIPNKLDMSVTPLVSHVEMCPYVLSAVVESLHHAPTAVWRLAESVIAVVMSRLRAASPWRLPGGAAGGLAPLSLRSGNGDGDSDSDDDDSDGGGASSSGGSSDDGGASTKRAGDEARALSPGAAQRACRRRARRACRRGARHACRRRANRRRRAAARRARLRRHPPRA